MKCKHCDGVGFFENGASQFKCVYCDGSGEVEMTNKEYYTETDEELAGFLSRICRDLLASVVEDGGSVPNEYIEEDREFWLTWLREKHE